MVRELKWAPPPHKCLFLNDINHFLEVSRQGLHACGSIIEVQLSLICSTITPQLKNVGQFWFWIPYQYFGLSCFDYFWGSCLSIFTSDSLGSHGHLIILNLSNIRNIYKINLLNSLILLPFWAIIFLLIEFF